jgi:hypothetical protein
VKRLMLDAAAGAVAGTVATVPMSAVMWTAQQAGLIRKQPPEEITEAALHTAGAHPPEQTENRITVVNHLLLGAVAGALFGSCHRALPETGRHVPAGAVYGLAVWATAYEGWVPALKIMPPAEEDQPGRPESMAVAHVVFGAVLAGVLRRLRRE